MDYTEYFIRAKEHLRETYDLASIQKLDQAHETCLMCLAEVRMALHADFLTVVGIGFKPLAVVFSP